MDWQEFSHTLIGWATTGGVRLAVALLVMLLTFKIIHFIGRQIERSASTRHVDKTVMRTAAYIFRLAAKSVVIISLVGFVGIDTGGLTALIASFGVGIGLAVNGALANLAGGVLIVMTRPFRVDDYIEAQGYAGTVEDIRITYTRLRTPDNKVIFIPNGELSSDTIVNYSMQNKRRIDEMIAISYREDWARVRSVLLDICQSHPLILQDPAPMVRMSEYGDSAVRVLVRVWVETENFWTVRFDLLEVVKARFDREGIEIPYSQMDVHIKRD